MTNVIGTQNIIRSAIENGVEKVIFTSSDKAANPTTVMGAGKLYSERLMSHAISSREIQLYFLLCALGMFLAPGDAYLIYSRNRLNIRIM